MDMTGPLFQLDQVRFRSVLHIDHLQLPDHRITCIVGASGSGKSTLLRLLNRLISPTAGTVRYRGADVATIDAVQLRRQVVMLPQNPIMFDGSIRENILAGLRFSERPLVDDAEIARLLALVNIEKLPDTNAAYLSGGERQRVAICRVLAMRPDVLLLDEPTSALDSGTEQHVIAQVVAEAQAHDTNLVMVTHSRDVAAAWGDLLVTIAAGTIANEETHD